MLVFNMLCLPLEYHRNQMSNLLAMYGYSAKISYQICSVICHQIAAYDKKVAIRYSFSYPLTVPDRFSMLIKWPTSCRVILGINVYPKQMHSQTLIHARHESNRDESEGWGFKSSLGKTFFVSNTSAPSQKHPFVSRKRMLLPVYR